MIKQSLIAVAAALFAAPAQAVILIDASEVGAQTIFSFEGSLDIAGLTPGPNLSDFEGIDAEDGAILFSGSTGMDRYAIPSLPGFGTSSVSVGTATGDQFKIFSNDRVAFASGYAGETISGSLTVDNSFAGLGLLPGLYTTAVPTTGDTIELTIPGPDAVIPLPATAPLLLGALGLFGLLRRRG